MRRRRWVGAVLVPISVVSLCAAQVALRAPAYAALRGIPAHAAAKPLEPGTAAAGANLLGVSPGVSSLSLTTMIGESTAALQHEATQSKSAIVDLSTLGVVLATNQFCGRSSLPQSEQPQPILADSETGPHVADHSTLPGVGEEHVSASRAPQSAAATTTFLSESLPGILAASGKSTASVRFVKGKGQFAASSVTEDVSLLGGMVKLEGMKWQATRSAGTSSARATHFSFGQVMLNGTPMKASTSSTAAGTKAINQVLAPFGFSFLQPAQTTNAETGAISIGPLTLRFRGSTIERSLISPAGKAVIALEGLLAKNSTAGPNCADFRQLLYNVSTNVETVLNLALAISQGGGVLDVDFGGATASALNATNYTNPFDVTGPPTNPLNSSFPPPRTPQSSIVGPGPLTEPTTVAGTGPPVDTPEVATAAGSPASTVVCRSTSTVGSQHCWRGVATVASIVALATGVVLLALDLYATRSRRPLLRRRYRRV
jgi:hypothetical protein